MIQYACCNPMDSPSDAHSLGNNAPPAIPTINTAEAVFVYFPKPFIARGQIAGHTSALARPRIAIKKTLTVPLVNMAHKEKMMPSIAENFNAADFEMYLGINAIPDRNQTSIQIMM